LLAGGTYARTGQDDIRFTDYFGSSDVIVTSSGNNDSGMFETNLHEDRFLPFEGAGAMRPWSAWPEACRVRGSGPVSASVAPWRRALSLSSRQRGTLRIMLSRKAPTSH
jgi:hypothetical protein